MVSLHVCPSAGAQTGARTVSAAKIIAHTWRVSKQTHVVIVTPPSQKIRRFNSPLGISGSPGKTRTCNPASGGINSLLPCNLVVAVFEVTSNPSLFNRLL